MLQLRADLVGTPSLGNTYSSIRAGQSDKQPTQLAATVYQGSGGLPGEETFFPLVLNKTKTIQIHPKHAQNID